MKTKVNCSRKMGRWQYPLGNTEAGAINFNLEFKLPSIHIK